MKKVIANLLLGILIVSILCCSDSKQKPNPILGETSTDTSIHTEPPRSDTSGQCIGICNASTPSIPMLDSAESFGDITTYGSVVNPAPSQGGACNYGATQIYAFAAVQVNQLPNDLKGQWNGGHICGQCVEVSLRSATGWKSTVIRIMDKCPDGYCGIDLGGQPAKQLMGDLPGRYSGKWTFVSCDGHADVFDGPPSLFVKEGSNAYWSLIQVRNASERILQIRMRPSQVTVTAEWTYLLWATEAENFFKVPNEILQDSRDYELQVVLPSGPKYRVILKGSDLGRELASLPLSSL